jgi:NAD(P)-dependent dehydrogenase (short-subunit alcohol dehydrogenase family)
MRADRSCLTTRQSTRAPRSTNRHLLLVAAGPGLGLAVARRFAVGGYRLTLVARSTDGLGDLAAGLSDTGADIGTMAADASDPGGLGGRLGELSAPALTRRTLLSATATLSRPTAGGRRSTASRANNGQESARPTS